MSKTEARARLKNARAFVLTTIDYDGNIESFADTEQANAPMQDMRHWALKQIAEAAAKLVLSSKDMAQKQALGLDKKPPPLILTKEER